MTRRLRRLKHFDVEITIKDDAFIQTPREMQRNWLINRALKEFTDDLTELDDLASRFVRGNPREQTPDLMGADLSPVDIMEDWQIPIMKAMAEEITTNHGDILEIGFGRGVASKLLQERGVRSHTIVECNPTIAEMCRNWSQQYPDRTIRVIEGRWQDVKSEFDRYDGIFFHTYPMDEAEMVDYVVQSVTFAAHFFPTASAHLREGGSFTYLTNEIDSFSRAHQRLVFEYFSSLSMRLVELDLPENIMDRWWADSMVVARAVK